MINFQTSPEKYAHWKLTFDGPVANLTMDVQEDTTLRDIGEDHGKTATQVALRWLVQQDNVAAIPKSATPENIKANMNIFDFELSEDDMKAIFAMATADGRQVNPDFAPKWDIAA